MPIYEYLCQDCQTRYERLVLAGNGDFACPKCGSQKATLQFSVFSSPSVNAAPDADGSSCGCSPSGCGCNN